MYQLMQKIKIVNEILIKKKQNLKWSVTSLNAFIFNDFHLNGFFGKFKFLNSF